jgi:hypothetical protein
MHSYKKLYKQKGVQLHDVVQTVRCTVTKCCTDRSAFLPVEEKLIRPEIIIHLLKIKNSKPCRKKPSTVNTDGDKIYSFPLFSKCWFRDW